jgi:host factor-I protein
MSSRRKEVAMGKVVFNVQDQFLNQARKERVPIIVTLIDNTKVEGFVKSFDPFCILIQTEKPILIYKHAVGRIEPAEVNSKLKDFLAG